MPTSPIAESSNPWSMNYDPLFPPSDLPPCHNQPQYSNLHVQTPFIHPQIVTLRPFFEPSGMYSVVYSVFRKMDPETKPIQTLEAGSGSRGISFPGPWSIWLERRLHVGMGSWSLGVLTLWGESGKGRRSQSPLGHGAQRRQPSFSSPKEILPAPRSVNKSDPTKWAKFRAQAQSLSEQEKIVRRKKKSHGSW